MNKKINLNDDLILDGAMGTLVMERENPKAGFPPELFNIENNDSHLFTLSVVQLRPDRYRSFRLRDR